MRHGRAAGKGSPGHCEDIMKKALIVYHSRSGYTRRVAQALARRLGAELEEIRIVQPMDGALGYAACAIEAVAGLTPALRPMRRNPADYSLVLVGTPVWFWSLSSPVRSWLEAHRTKLGRVAFFCTMGGSGARRVFATMAALLGRQPLATLALADAQIDAGVDDRLDAFVRSLQPPRRAARGAAARRGRASMHAAATA
jgi:flavodoxin